MQPHKSLLLLADVTFPTASALAQQHDEMMIQMQPGADRMKVAIRSPAHSATITGDKIALQVSTTGFKSRCDLAGTPDQPGTGHYHVLLDKSLVNMYCEDRAAVSLEGVKPGRHTLTAVPAQNDQIFIVTVAQDRSVNLRLTRRATSSLHGPRMEG